MSGARKQCAYRARTSTETVSVHQAGHGQIGFRAGGGRCGRFGRRLNFSTVSCVRELASCMCPARGEGAHTCPRTSTEAACVVQAGHGQIGFRLGGGRCGRFQWRFKLFNGELCARVSWLYVSNARKQCAYRPHTSTEAAFVPQAGHGQIGFRAGGGRCGRSGRRLNFSTVSCVRELAS